MTDTALRVKPTIDSLPQELLDKICEALYCHDQYEARNIRQTRDPHKTLKAIRLVNKKFCTTATPIFSRDLRVIFQSDNIDEYIQPPAGSRSQRVEPAYHVQKLLPNAMCQYAGMTRTLTLEGDWDLASLNELARRFSEFNSTKVLGPDQDKMPVKRWSLGKPWLDAILQRYAQIRKLSLATLKPQGTLQILELAAVNNPCITEPVLHGAKLPNDGVAHASLFDRRVYEKLPTNFMDFLARLAKVHIRFSYRKVREDGPDWCRWEWGHGNAFQVGSKTFFGSLASIKELQIEHLLCPYLEQYLRFDGLAHLRSFTLVDVCVRAIPLQEALENLKPSLTALRLKNVLLSAGHWSTIIPGLEHLDLRALEYTRIDHERESHRALRPKTADRSPDPAVPAPWSQRMWREVYERFGFPTEDPWEFIVDQDQDPFRPEDAPFCGPVRTYREGDMTAWYSLVSKCEEVGGSGKSSLHLNCSGRGTESMRDSEEIRCVAGIVGTAEIGLPFWSARCKASRPANMNEAAAQRIWFCDLHADQAILLKDWPWMQAEEESIDS